MTLEPLPTLRGRFNTGPAIDAYTITVIAGAAAAIIASLLLVIVCFRLHLAS